MKISTIKSSFITLISVLFLLLIWKIASATVNSEIILPAPEAVFTSLISIVKSENFIFTVTATVIRAVYAFLISCIAGVIIGLFMGFSRTANLLIKPIFIAAMSTPVISFILLALIWFKSGDVPVFVTFLITFPIITANVSEGIRNVDEKLIQMAKTYRIKKWRILSDIYFPSIASYLAAGISTAVGIGWKVVVTAEVLSQPQYAIGTKMETAKMYLETSSVFAWTLIAVVLSFIFEKLIRVSEKRIFKWR